MLRRMERVSSGVPAVSSDDTGSHCASSDQDHGPGQQVVHLAGAIDVADAGVNGTEGNLPDLATRAGRRSGYPWPGHVLGRVVAATVVGTQESMMQAIRSTRPGGHVGYVGVSHGVQLPGEELFFSATHLYDGPAPVRRFLPEMIDLIWQRRIDPGKVCAAARPSARRLRAGAGGNSAWLITRSRSSARAWPTP